MSRARRKVDEGVENRCAPGAHQSFHMANTGISKREFARREDCPDSTIRKAITSGRLKTFPDGTLDPALVGTGWRKSNVVDIPDRPKRPSKGAHHSAHPGAQVRTADDAPVDESSEREQRAQAMVDNGVVQLLPFGEAVARKENYIALLRQLEYEEKSGALVPLDLAERVLFEGARAMRDAWLNWPSRVGPLIAADLGLEADRVTEALTEHVHKHIAQLGEPDVQFTADR